MEYYNEKENTAHTHPNIQRVKHRLQAKSKRQTCNMIATTIKKWQKEMREKKKCHHTLHGTGNSSKNNLTFGQQHCDPVTLAIKN